MAPANLTIDTIDFDTTKRTEPGYISLKEFLEQTDGVYRHTKNDIVPSVRVYTVESLHPDFYRELLRRGWRVNRTGQAEHGYYIDIVPFDTEDIASRMRVLPPSDEDE